MPAGRFGDAKRLPDRSRVILVWIALLGRDGSMGARRLGLGSLVSLCVSVGALLACSIPALAAAPEAPSLEVTGRKATEVSLRGVLYPNATGEPGSYEILYKQSASECEGGSKTPSGVATGNQFEEVFETLTGLDAGKQYTVCLAVTSPGGTTISAPVTVTTATPPEIPVGLEAQALTATSVTLHGVLNPLAESKSELGTYEFLYKRSASECEGEFSTPTTGAAGVKQEAVSVPVAKLLPHATYSFCLRQANEAEEVATSAPVSFMTPAAAPIIEEASVNHVTASSATLSAKINPQGAETSYTFEYAPAGGAFASVPEAEGKGSLPEGDAGVPVSVHVQAGLLAHTSYQFRVTAINPVGTVPGAPVPFTTQTLGVTASLQDGRQWEMVSPLQKEGAALAQISEGIIQAAADGNAFTDMSYAEPIEEDPASAYNNEANFFGRGPDGWTSKTIAPPHSAAGPLPIGQGQEYRFFSEDLSTGILQPFGPVTPLASGVSQSTPYIRTNFLNGDPGVLCGSGCYQPLVSDANTPTGTQYGEEENGPCRNTHCGPEVVAVNPDLNHVLIKSSVALTAGFKGGIYEWTNGELTFVGNGELGSDGLLRHVISDNGSRVVVNGFYEGMSGLLVRDTVTGETVQIGPGDFADASSDGSRIFLYNNAELFEYNLNAPADSRVSDLSVDSNPDEAAGVSSVLGASEDGSYVYFAASGVLATGATPAGCNEAQPCMNLYVRHGGTTRFVTGLSSEDYPVWTIEPGNGLSARVSPNGRWLAFMSNRDLTGYDTTDAVSGHSDEEVYLYDASTGKLVCASCDPTGARPVGVEYGSDGSQLVKGDRVFRVETWIASNVPPWTRLDLNSASYQSRYLSNSGRLFFDSHDALVSQDVNGTQDVYEYEPTGVGDCDVAKDTFDETSGGCVSLLSSGESSEESAFLDASETGGDVFFLTTSKLVMHDFDNSYDVYDARECGSGPSRCLASEPASSPPCGTGDSCKSAPSPQPAIFGSPSSATFSGAGNITRTKPAPVKAKALTRVQRFVHALDACHAKKGKRRKTCERKVNAQYGARKPHKTHANKRSGR